MGKIQLFSFLCIIWLVLLTQFIFYANGSDPEKEKLDGINIEGDILLHPDHVEPNEDDGEENEETSTTEFDDAVIPNMFYQNSAMRNKRNLWINKIIPYEIDRRLGGRFTRTIKLAINEYHTKTCIKLVRRTKEKNWVKFVKSNMCLSPVGKRYNSGMQKIYLGPRCNSKHIVMHEIMHTLGFWHEISRPDRDQYVEIMWENIPKKERSNFKRYSDKTIDTLGLMYDYHSLLHYQNKAFSRNGKDTVRSVKNPKRIFGRARSFSRLDIIKINAVYDCKGRIGGWSSWSRYGPCDYRCEKYRQRFCYSRNRNRDCPMADKHGLDTEVVKCSKKQCYAPVNGLWSRWSEWSPCSQSCGWGNQTRTRQCDDPAPKHGGKPCAGKRMETKLCYMDSRGPVHYRFLTYSPRHNKCLSSYGNQVIMENCNKTNDKQLWGWSAYDQLVNIASGECLDSTLMNKGKVNLSRCCKESKGQQWQCNGNMVTPNKTAILNLNYGRKSKKIRLYLGKGQNSQWEIFGSNGQNVCTKKQVCKVKTERNGCCVFPFNFLGKTYNSCALSKETNKLWCATSKRFPYELKWGYCDIKKEDCKVKTKKGECCVFPFKFKNRWYKSCTTAYFGNKRWCSTTRNYDTDKKWGLCP